MGNGLVSNKVSCSKSSVIKDKASDLIKTNHNKQGPLSRRLQQQTPHLTVASQEETKKSPKRLRLQIQETFAETKMTIEEVDTAEMSVSPETMSATRNAETKSTASPRSLECQCRKDVRYPETKTLHRRNTDPTRSPVVRWKSNTDRPITPPAAKRDRAHHTFNTYAAEHPLAKDKYNVSNNIRGPASPPARSSRVHYSYDEEDPSLKDKYQISKLIVKRVQASVSDPQRRRLQSEQHPSEQHAGSECSHVGCGSTCRYAVAHVGFSALQMRLRRKNLSLINLSL